MHCSILPNVYLHNVELKGMINAINKYCKNVIMISAKEEKISKQIQLTKHMPPDMKHIILANMNVKLYS